MRSLDVRRSVCLSVCECVAAWRHNNNDVIAFSLRHQQIVYDLTTDQQQRRRRLQL